MILTMDITEVVSQIRSGDKIGLMIYLGKGGDPNARNNMNWTLLHLACLEGQAEIVEVLLNSAALVNSCTPDMCTPLHRACIQGSLKTVEVLVSKGAYINAQDKNGNTPLHEAARALHTPITKLLIEKKADKSRLNKKNQRFTEVIGQQMMSVVESGDIDALLQWLDWGLSPNTVGNFNWSILHHACARGQINIASVLLEREANVNACDSNKGTPLHTAAFHGHKRIVDLLIGKGADFNSQDQLGNTPLHSAIAGEHPDIINTLLDNGCDTTIANSEGQIFTHLVNEFLVEAVENKRVAYVCSLLKGRANPDTKDPRGYPVLCCAAFQEDLLTADALLHAGADPNVCSETNQKTPLHYAASWGNLFIAKSLLDKGASVSLTDHLKRTPLHEAAQNGAEDVVRVLIGRSVSLNAQDIDGNTALHIAARWGQSDIVDLLIEREAKDDIRNNDGHLYMDLALMRAVRTENTAQVLSCLAWGGNPDVKDNKGWSLLHHAVYKEALEVVRLLIESESQVNVADKEGRTPLLLASYRGNVEITRELMDAGADLDSQDKRGRTPLHWAAAEGSADTVDLLLQRGAKGNIRNKEGQLYSDLLVKHLYLAVRHNDSQKVERLLKAGANQTVEVFGTGTTPRAEAKRRKHYPLLREMIAAVPKKTSPIADDTGVIEDIGRLFEVEGGNEDERCNPDGVAEGDEYDYEDEEAYEDPDEDAYWRMHNAPLVLSAKELFEEENKGFWEHWDEKPKIIKAQELFKEDKEEFWSYWKSIESSSSESGNEEDGSETDPNVFFRIDRIKRSWGKILSAKEVFKEEQCWWSDAVEELDDAPVKAISAKEFFKEDSKPWWEEDSSGQSSPHYPWDEAIPAKEFFKEDECWWRDAVEDLDAPKVISAKEFFQEDKPWWEESSEESSMRSDGKDTHLRPNNDFGEDDKNYYGDTDDEVSSDVIDDNRSKEIKPYGSKASLRKRVQESFLVKQQKSAAKSILKKSFSPPLCRRHKSKSPVRYMMSSESDISEEFSGSEAYVTAIRNDDSLIGLSHDSFEDQKCWQEPNFISECDREKENDNKNDSESIYEIYNSDKIRDDESFGEEKSTYFGDSIIDLNEKKMEETTLPCWKGEINDNDERMDGEIELQSVTESRVVSLEEENPSTLESSPMERSSFTPNKEVSSTEPSNLNPKELKYLLVSNRSLEEEIHPIDDDQNITEEAEKGLGKAHQEPNDIKGNFENEIGGQISFSLIPGKESPCSKEVPQRQKGLLSPNNSLIENVVETAHDKDKRVSISCDPVDVKSPGLGQEDIKEAFNLSYLDEKKSEKHQTCTSEINNRNLFYSESISYLEDKLDSLTYDSVKMSGNKESDPVHLEEMSQHLEQADLERQEEELEIAKNIKGKICEKAQSVHRVDVLPDPTHDVNRPLILESEPLIEAISFTSELPKILNVKATYLEDCRDVSKSQLDQTFDQEDEPTKTLPKVDKINESNLASITREVKIKKRSLKKSYLKDDSKSIKIFNNSECKEKTNIEPTEINFGLNSRGSSSESTETKWVVNPIFSGLETQAEEDEKHNETLLKSNKKFFNKIDECLARVDAKLAWVDARLASDVDQSNKKCELNQIPTTNEKNNQPNLEQGSSPGTSTDKKNEKSQLKIFKIKVSVPKGLKSQKTMIQAKKKLGTCLQDLRKAKVILKDSTSSDIKSIPRQSNNDESLNQTSSSQESLHQISSDKLSSSSDLDSSLPFAESETVKSRERIDTSSDGVLKANVMDDVSLESDFCVKDKSALSSHLKGCPIFTQSEEVDENYKKWSTYHPRTLEEYDKLALLNSFDLSMSVLDKEQKCQSRLHNPTNITTDTCENFLGRDAAYMMSSTNEPNNKYHLSSQCPARFFRSVEKQPEILGHKCSQCGEAAEVTKEVIFSLSGLVASEETLKEDSQTQTSLDPLGPLEETESGNPKTSSHQSTEARVKPRISSEYLLVIAFLAIFQSTAFIYFVLSPLFR